MVQCTYYFGSINYPTTPICIWNLKGILKGDEFYLHNNDVYKIIVLPPCYPYSTIFMPLQISNVVPSSKHTFIQLLNFTLFIIVSSKTIKFTFLFIANDFDYCWWPSRTPERHFPWSTGVVSRRWLGIYVFLGNVFV